MVTILTPVLYAFTGFFLYAALHHGSVALHRPRDRVHLLFALTCMIAALFTLAEIGAYQAQTPWELVVRWQWKFSFALAALTCLLWFTAEYTGVRHLRLLVFITLVFAGALVINFVLPYGLVFGELPRLEYITLPWGERVTDLGSGRRSEWFHVVIIFGVAVYLYAIYACVYQYRRNHSGRAKTLAVGIALLLAAALFNQAVNYGLVQFVHTAQLGILLLVITMSQGLTRELSQSKTLMRDILDQVPAVVYLKDIDGRYLLSNRQHQALLGFDAGRVLGRTDADLFPAEQANAFRANDRRVLDSRQAQTFEEVTDMSGAPRTYHSLKFPLHYADGRPYGVCGISTDVTEQNAAAREMRELRDQVWHADRVARIGTLSSSFAHELNQPLAAILANAQAGGRVLAAAARGTGDMDEMEKIFQDIVRDCKRAGAVIGGMRALLKRQDAAPATIDLASAIDEVLGLIHSEFVERQVEVSVDFEPDCLITIDKAQVQQVLVNLALNALDAMQAQPVGQRHLHVAVRGVDPDTVQVTVRDSGGGIPSEQMPRIFEAFHTTKPQGLGLGLAVCRSIIETHGGRIWAQANPDVGATFCFTLPLVTASAMSNDSERA